jgi:hypothetical protein
MTSVLRCALWLSLAVALALSAQTGLGQELPAPLTQPPIFRAQTAEPDTMRAYTGEPQTQFGDTVQDGLLFGDQLSGRNGEAYGALFRAGVSTGPAIGRTDTIVPLEIMPYAFHDNAMLFGVVRGFRASTDGWGMNVGGGLRYYSEKWDRIIGANAFYDYDNSSGGLFREVGFGVETLGALWDMRANAYMPTGKTDLLLKSELVAGSQRFVDHRLLYDNLLTFGNALRGVDWELGIPIPGRVPMRHDFRVFGGWYYYTGTSTDGFAGWKIRAQANILQNLNAQLDVNHDKVFDTTVVFGATWTYGGYKQPDGVRRTQFDRMTEMVRRNYNVVVSQLPFLDADKVAINPNTNAPYFFEHVASYANPVGMDGTIDHPWQNLTQATTALNVALPNPADQAGNIIFVHANSVYSTAPDNTVTLIPTVRILGEGDGVQHRVRIADLGFVPLPRATTFTDRPLFTNQAGNAVTLVSGTAAAPSEFSGFQIGNATVPSSGPAGIGIIGDGVGNVIVNQTDVNFAQGHGVFLNNLNGTVAMLGDTINNVGNTNTAIDSMRIVGGTGQFFFGTEPVSLKNSVINNTGGHALVIDSTNRGSSYNFTGSSINDGTLTTGLTGGGILLNDIDGLVVIDNATIVNTVTSANTTGRAIDIEGTAATPLTPARGLGQITFVGGIAIDNPQDDAIHIQDMQVDTTVTPNLVSAVRFILPNPVNGVLAPGIRITNRNAGGINMLNNAGNISFLEPVSIATNAAAAVQPLQAAIDFEGNSGSASFLTILPSSSNFQIQISGGGGNGLQIGATAPNTGTFRTTGATNITQIAQTSLLIGSAAGVGGPASNQGNVTMGDVNIDQRGERGIHIVNVDHFVQFSGLTQVGNANNSLFSAVDIHDNLVNTLQPRVAGDVAFRTLNIQAAQGPVTIPIASGAGLNVVNNPTSVAIQTLNINVNSLVGSGTALFADNVGTRPAIISTTSTDPALGLSIGSGTIFANGGPAVSIQDSVIGINLTAVNSDNSVTDGIFLSNNVGTGSEVTTNAVTIHPVIFNVSGVANGFGTGGLIRGATLEGAFILDSESVVLRNMDYTGNTLNGIYATTPNLSIFNNRITANGGFGVNVYAIAVPLTQNNRTLQTVDPSLTIQGSTITTNGNGATVNGTQQILFTAGTLGNYTVNIGAQGLAAQNTISHTYPPNFATGINEPRPPAAGVPAPTTDDGILIRTLGTASGSTLDVSIVNNIVSAIRPAGAGTTPLSAVRIDWDGRVNTGNIKSNTFNFGSDGTQGLVLNLPSTTESSNFRIAGNTFNAPNGTGKTGIDVTTNGGPANIQIGALDGLNANVMTFISNNNGNAVRIDDIGMLFNLGPASFVNIFNNQITMTGLDAEAIQFATVASPTNARTSVTMNSNTIDMNGGLFNLAGIEILSVTSGTMNLFGTLSNDITINGQTGSTVPWFFAPATGTQGQITVNNVGVP